VRSLSRSHLLLMSPPLSPLFSYAAPTPHLSPLSLHDALPISLSRGIINALQNTGLGPTIDEGLPIVTGQDAEIASIKLIADGVQDRKSTRLNSSHVSISYAVFCLKKKN